MPMTIGGTIWRFSVRLTLSGLAAYVLFVVACKAVGLPNPLPWLVDIILTGELK